MTTWRFANPIPIPEPDPRTYTGAVIRAATDGTRHLYVIERKRQRERTWDAWLADTRDSPRRHIGATGDNGVSCYAITPDGTRLTGADPANPDDALSELINAAFSRDPEPTDYIEPTH